MTTLAERLGHEADTRILLVACSSLGQAHASNIAVYEALQSGIATSASLMVPCPWARDAAARHDGEDIGVELTLNAELERYRWGPVTMAPSLIDGDGGFPRTVDDLWDHADLDEVRRECRAQLERAALWGFDVSHITTHLGALVGRPEFFDVYLDIACDYRLPIELPAAATDEVLGFPARHLAAEEGVVLADHVIDATARPTRNVLERLVDQLAPGVTVLRIAPACDTPEIRGLDPDWSRRVDDYLVSTHDATASALVQRSGAVTVGYEQLRSLMR